MRKQAAQSFRASPDRLVAPRLLRGKLHALRSSFPTPASSVRYRVCVPKSLSDEGPRDGKGCKNEQKGICRARAAAHLLAGGYRVLGRRWFPIRFGGSSI